MIENQTGHNGIAAAISAIGEAAMAMGPAINCPHCGAHYEPEPGFFTGAMYFSYAFSVAIFIVFGIGIFWLLHDPSISVYMVGVIVPTILLIPLNFRYSRVLMLYLFSDLRFDPEAQ